MYFSSEQLEQIADEYSSVKGKYEHLLLAYTGLAYEDPRAREYASQGFSRRLRILARRIENTFRLLPPDRADRPTKDELGDAMINIQAFVFNVFGSVDNLAWIWVCEKSITTADGSPLKTERVGLGRKHRIVRASFSAEFQRYPKASNDWFKHLEDYRHALAHRIPLYIPPCVLSIENEAAYQELETRKAEALRHWNIEEHDRLSREQDALGTFEPLIKHSFEEKSRPVAFHPQMLADFNTVVELGQKILSELDL
jgi:hypothetical protein